MYQMFRMLFSLNNDTLILFLVKNFFVQEINMEKWLKQENARKVPIVMPKVTFLGTFGTTIGLFANETYYQALSRLRYTIS